MSQQVIFLPEIGEVTLSKRKGARNLRISINAAGKVRVGMPYFTPYQVGVAFAKSRTEWIKKHQAQRPAGLLRDGDLIGKAHRITYKYIPFKNGVAIKLSTSQIIVISGLPIGDSRVQTKLQTACERALKAEAGTLLPQRLKLLAQKNGYQYKSVNVRKLTARWGSCSSQGIITVSYYLVQLPWELIDYVLLHELVHTKHMHHGRSFWSEFTRALPDAKSLQKQIHTHRPLVQAYGVLAGR